MIISLPDVSVWPSKDVEKEQTQEQVVSDEVHASQTHEEQTSLPLEGVAIEEEKVVKEEPIEPVVEPELAPKEV